MNPSAQQVLPGWRLQALILSIAILSLASLGVVTESAYAHAFAPALLNVVQIADKPSQQFSVSWKTPLKQPPGSRLQAVLPPHCRPIGKAQRRLENSADVLVWQVDCGEQGLINQEIGASHIASSGTNVLVRVQLKDGRYYQQALAPNRDRFHIPEHRDVMTVLGSYAWLGISHMWLGADHLLFVLSLVVLMGYRRKLVWAISGFTLGHSITLSLAALDIVRVPPALAEILIAFSLILLAAAICKQAAGEHRGLPGQFPTSLTTVLGLVHGLGFAGALHDIGLPQDAIPHALLAFNVGIEIAQLLGIAALWAVLLVLQRLARQANHHAWENLQWRLPLAIPIGTVAAFWFWQRLLVF